MTRLLGSVTGADEAAIALAGGVDVIDLKDPSRGALGAMAIQSVRETVAAVGGRAPVSAVTGDAKLAPDTAVAMALALAEAGVDIVKQGIFAGEVEATVRALGGLAGRVRLVAVLFADRAPDLALLPLLHSCGFAGAMLDTADKARGRLLDHADLPVLRRFVDACRRHQLAPGLAGSLETPDIPRLLVLEPDVLGFRGALCGGDRTAGIRAEAVHAVRALIPRHAPAEAAPRVDYRLLAARGYAHDPNGDPALTDRVFVRDLVLPVRIGVYAREYDTPQPVRFAVDAMVLRSTRPSQDLADVFSYDVITDGIRMLVDAGHVGLVETLAERIAAMVLAHPRVVRVSVRLEKLETGNGIVGVEVARTRASAQAGQVFPFVADAP